MNPDEYHRRFADAIIEQIRKGTAPWQKPWGPGERGASLERGHRPPLRGGEQPAPRRGGRGEGLRRRPVGHLPPDPAQGRTGPEGGAGHPDPLLPGPPEGGGEGREGAARPGRRGRARLPARAARHPGGAAVHGVQRRAGRRAPAQERVAGRAALEGPPEGRAGARGPRSADPASGRATAPSTRSRRTRSRSPSGGSSPRPTTSTRPRSTSWGTAPGTRSG